ncbi:hypothetical protein ACWENQ_35645 [Nonomuraea sp. NPDC004354]|uniref:hypothetical protein n=1 Tax=Nonomuraea sp. NPDC003804 TaxID=3154547 RepID=UPI0033AB6778
MAAESESGSIRRLDDVARAIVAEVAPKEAEYYSVIAAATRRNPRTAFRGGGDDLLGFSAADAVMLVTPIVLTVLTGAATNTLTQAVERTAKQVSTKVWNKLFPPRPAPIAAPATVVPVFEPAQAKETAQAVEDIALALGVDKTVALRLRQATYGHLSGER